MFKKQVGFFGTHAQKITELEKIKEGYEEYKFMPRFLDTYMIAPLLGVLYNRKEAEDKDSVDGTPVSSRTIFGETLMKQEADLIMIFRMVMLFDQRDTLDLEERVRRAFKDFPNREHNDNHQNNMKLFNEYARGGISLLHEKVTKDAMGFDSYITNYYDFIEEFKMDFIDKADFSEIEHELK